MENERTATTNLENKLAETIANEMAINAAHFKHLAEQVAQTERKEHMKHDENVTNVNCQEAVKNGGLCKESRWFIKNSILLWNSVR